MVRHMSEKVMKSNGFTLIELMITIAIIGILSAIAIPQYQSYVMRGFRSETISILQNILTAQERYYQDNVEYTTDLSQLGISVNGSGEYITSEDRYKIQARLCTGSSAGLTVTQCIELIADSDGVQRDDGDLVTNSNGVQNRILVDSTVTTWY